MGAQGQLGLGSARTERGQVYFLWHSGSLLRMSLMCQAVCFVGRGEGCHCALLATITLAPSRGLVHHGCSFTLWNESINPTPISYPWLTPPVFFP